MGMLGEGLVDDSVLVVKSHFPERNGIGVFKVSKVVVITRHPLDCMSSLFNMIATVTHSQSIDQSKLDKPQIDGLWKEYILQEPPIWNKFNDFWFESPQKAFVHIVRYEDMLYHPKQTLTWLFEFILEKADGLKGTVIEQLIDQLALELSSEEGKQANQVYKPRVGQVGANLK